jgi:hypothetical protein
MNESLHTLARKGAVLVRSDVRMRVMVRHGILGLASRSAYADGALKPAEAVRAMPSLPPAMPGPRPGRPVDYRKNRKGAYRRSGQFYGYEASRPVLDSRERPITCRAAHRGVLATRRWDGLLARRRTAGL